MNKIIMIGVSLLFLTGCAAITETRDFVETKVDQFTVFFGGETEATAPEAK